MGAPEMPRHVALIVEDDPDLRSMAATLLEESDLQVAETSSPEEAIAYLRGHGSQVAFLFADIRQPCRVDGVDFAHRVHDEWPWVHVLVTTNSPDGLRPALPIGITCMRKPWRALDLLVQADRATRS